MRLRGIYVFGVAVGMLVISTAACADGFGFAQVVAKAKALSEKPYQAPAKVPKFLRTLDHSTYRQIRFHARQALWRAAGSRFQVRLVSPGLYYTHAVTINVVDAGGVHRLAYRKQDFSFPSRQLARQIPDSLGFAGFELTYPLQKAGKASPLLLFAGASRFRGVGQGTVFGAAARGVAVDTGLPSGEQFPAFTEFWLLRPNARAKQMTFFALLDGSSLTGAYRFTVRPGSPTRLQVRAVLFPRKAIRQLGVAPLTSMFYYGSNTARPAGNWRPQVHNSDGLLMHDGSGEWLWRPLLDPQTLKLDYFAAGRVRGFGLLQRDTSFRDYQDPVAHYQRRPSLWVTPHGTWGRGHVVLVEIPTSDATNENILAFWLPATPVRAGRRLTFDYTLAMGGPDVATEPMAHAARTFVGRGDAKGAYRFAVDFAGGPLAALPADTAVRGVVTGQDGTRVIAQSVAYVPELRQWRLSILARSADGKALALRAFLKRGGNTLTETWSYALPVHNSIGGGQ